MWFPRDFLYMVAISFRPCGVNESSLLFAGERVAYIHKVSHWPNFQLDECVWKRHHDDVVIWICLPHYWPFVRGIYCCDWWISLTKAQFCRRLVFALVLALASCSLEWHHNGCNGISNHQPHHCLLNRSFRHRSKKALKLRTTDLCGGNSLVTSEFPAQMASNTENVSIWWRHHGKNK